MKPKNAQVLLQTDKKVHVYFYYKFDEQFEGSMGLVLSVDEWNDGDISEETKKLVEDNIRSSGGYKTVSLHMETATDAK